MTIENKKRIRRPKSHINLTVGPELREALEVLAVEDDRTLSSYCRIVLTKHLEEFKNGLDKSSFSHAE